MNTAHLPPLLSVTEAGKILEFSRQYTYGLVKRREFPVEVRTIGRTYKVVTAELLRYLGLEYQPAHTGHTPCPTCSSEDDYLREVRKPVRMRTRTGTLKLIYPDRTYRVRGEKISGADLIERGYL